VLVAAPGAGKTTRVPPAVLALVRGEVLVLEPRRIAARLAARRVAFEMGEQAGETVGYQVRFEDKTGPRTRLRFVTEGILTRRLISDPELKGIDAVILDEFHERHLDTDLALALLRRLQRRRPELRIVVMSATLDTVPIAAFLGGCPVLRSEGRAYPLNIRHLPYSPDPLPVRLRKAVAQLEAEQAGGNILCFLPGTAEIRRAIRECESVARSSGLLVLPLSGDLSPAEQDRAVQPSAERKLILATNVAESSVTVDGVTAVIDSGLARFATYSAWSGLPTLEVGRVSKASATQRAGRAGRTAPGRVLRLYSEEDLQLRAPHDAPEIVRADLAQLLLSLRAMGFADPGELDWLDPPPAAAVAAATTLLDRLGVDAASARQLARLPLPPRLARMVAEAIERGAGEQGCRAAALLSLRERSPRIDVLAALDQPPSPMLEQQTAHLLRVARPPARQQRHDDDALLLALLTGFPDRVARRRAGDQVLLANGLSAQIETSSPGDAPRYEFLLALDAEDRRENPLPLIRVTARVEPEWLLDLFPDRVTERVAITWNRGTERVERVSALLYDQLVLEETRGNASPDEAAEMLAQRAMEAGINHFVDTAQLENLQARLAFAGLPAPDLARTLRAVCQGLHSFNDLRGASASLLPMLESNIDQRRLNELAPATLRLPSGRQTRIHYETDRPPWIASRLQDFFGMADGPRIGPERTALVIHLLAPNQRAVQTTTDLAGFWQRLYPRVRKELMRRYPRHQWPENPIPAR
jgi:ATP-dependent helicase HrpB